MTQELSKHVSKSYFLKPTVPFDSEAIFTNRSTKEWKFENGPYMKIAFDMPILWGKLVKQFVDGLKESSVYFLEDEKSTSTKKQSASDRSQAISCNLIKQENCDVRRKFEIGI